MIVETIGQILLTSLRPIFSWSSSLIIFGPVFVSTVILAYYWSSIRFTWKRLKQVDDLPGPRCTSIILGNIPFEMVRTSVLGSSDHKMSIIMAMSSITGYTQVFRKQKIFRIWLSWEPLVFVWHPETAEKVLSNNFLLEKSAQYKFLHPWLGTGLLTSDGSKWRTRRKMLVPAFHFKILHDFVPVFNEHAKVLVQRLRMVARRKCANCTVVDIVPIITACTLDIICETIMGVSIGAQKAVNNKYCKSVTEVGECFLERLMQPQYWPDSIYYRSGPGSKFSSNLIRLHTFTRKVIKERKAEKLNSNITIRFRPTNGGQVELEELNEKERRKVFLDLLLDHHINSNGESMTEEDIREEVDTFMFEGHDTTAMALSWTLYMLGHNPEIQAKAAAEVDSVFDEIGDSSYVSNGSVSHEIDENDNEILLDLEKIKSLKYLECCIKEGLRLCPSVPFVGRRTHEDMDFNGYRVPKGTVLFVYIYMLHRDPDVFPNPEQYDPDRFLPENSVGRHPFAFVPFSAGPRNCIGQRFAMSELKVVLAYLLRYFRFESLDHRDKISAMMEMVYRPKSPLNLRVYERRKAEVFDPTPAPSSTPLTLEMLLKINQQHQQQHQQQRRCFDGSSGNISLMDLGVGSSNADSQRSYDRDSDDQIDQTFPRIA